MELGRKTVGLQNLNFYFVILLEYIVISNNNGKLFLLKLSYRMKELSQSKLK